KSRRRWKSLRKGLYILETANPSRGGDAKPWALPLKEGRQVTERVRSRHARRDTRATPPRLARSHLTNPEEIEDRRTGPAGHGVESERGKGMTKWLARMRQFLLKEDGPTAVEYAVMLALIIVVCIAAIGTLGSNASNTFSNVAQKAAPAGGSS